MPWLDLILFIPLALGGYFGWKNGVLDDIVHGLHFLIAFALSFKILSVLLYFLDAYIFTFSTRSAMGINAFSAMLFASSVGATFVLLSTLGKYLKTEIEYDFPGAWDNIAGAIFGVLRNVLVMSFLLWFLQAFGEFNPEIRKKSFLAPFIENVAYTIVGVKDAGELSDTVREFSGLQKK